LKNALGVLAPARELDFLIQKSEVSARSPGKTALKRELMLQPCGIIGNQRVRRVLN
jgi:hypothetical protein